MSVELHVSLRKRTSEIGVNWYFSLFLFFCGNINQDHKLLPNCVFRPFTYVYCGNCMSGFSALAPNLSKSGNILFRSMPNGNCLFSSASIVIDN